MWSRGPSCRTSRAAAFCTRCSGAIVDDGEQSVAVINSRHDQRQNKSYCDFVSSLTTNLAKPSQMIKARSSNGVDVVLHAEFIVQTKSNSRTEFADWIVSDPMVIDRSRPDNLERFARDPN